MQNNIGLRYFSKNITKFTNIPECINCKYFSPNNYSPNDLLLGFCTKFKIVDRFYSIAIFYPAKICRESDKLCGEKGYSYVKKQ